MSPDAPIPDPPTPLPQTVGAAARLTVDGLVALAELGEKIDDEWQYVQDLLEAWRTRLEAVEGARNDEALSTERGVAVARIVDEAGLIADPHRAIDWLSTLPQVALVAIGERP